MFFFLMNDRQPVNISDISQWLMKCQQQTRMKHFICPLCHGDGAENSCGIMSQYWNVPHGWFESVTMTQRTKKQGTWLYNVPLTNANLDHKHTRPIDQATTHICTKAFIHNSEELKKAFHIKCKRGFEDRTSTNTVVLFFLPPSPPSKKDFETKYTNRRQQNMYLNAFRNCKGITYIGIPSL